LTEAGRFGVRRLGPQDADAYSALVARAAHAGELLGSSAPHGEWLDRFPHAEPSEVAVAEADGRLVGVVLPEVKALVVETAYRRRGIGRALVDAGLEIERERVVEVEGEEGEGLPLLVVEQLLVDVANVVEHGLLFLFPVGRHRADAEHPRAMTHVVERANR